jgi:hypothetical protein
MRSNNLQTLRCLLVAGALATGCGSESPTSPTARDIRSASPPAFQLGEATAAAPAASRPLRGECQTTFTPIDPVSAGACSAFVAAPSAFIQISGVCYVSHLGRATVEATQQILFHLNSSGTPVIVNGQPVVDALRNCGVFTAANGDLLRHTATGTVAPGEQPGVVTLEGALTFSGGTGRFASASGSAGFAGSANLTTNTGLFSFQGDVIY